MSDFNHLVADAKEFLTRLAAENTRDWFLEHKSEYDTKLKGPATLLLDQIAARLGKRFDTSVKPKLFRANRDVRFSKDKTPYHTHLHMLWSDTGGPDAPGWFFGIAPDYVTAGWGYMGFTPSQLTTWRALVDSDESIADEIAATGMTLREPALKRVPAPFAKDHPRGELLRHKALTLWQEFEPVNLEEDLLEQFEKAAPLHRSLTPRL